MSAFITKLSGDFREDNEEIYVIDSALIYNSDLVGQIYVPKGFQTDFASVPRLPIIYALWGNRAHHEAVLHDYLYRIDAFTHDYDPSEITRSVANEVFLEAMGVRGKPCTIKYPMYAGVCIGGWTKWHKCRVADII